MGCLALRRPLLLAPWPICPPWNSPLQLASNSAPKERAANVVNNRGQISIFCPGVDPKALQFLEERLSEKIRDLCRMPAPPAI